MTLFRTNTEQFYQIQNKYKNNFFKITILSESVRVKICLNIKKKLNRCLFWF